MWMKRCALIAQVSAFVVAVFVLGPAFGGDTPTATASSIVDQLAGSWRLVSRVTTAADGKVLVDPGLSSMPIGVLIYDRTGHVAAQLSRPGRTVAALADECRAAEKVKGTNDTAQTILGYDAYFGTFTIDPKESVITHHLESALFPGDIGKDIKRSFSISGDTLTIKFHTTIADGTSVVRTLVWTRVK